MAQKRLLELFVSTGEKNVETVHDPRFLKAVYGTHSSIVHIAKSMLRVQVDQKLTYLKDRKKSKNTEESLIEAENSYWDVANQVRYGTAIVCTIIIGE